MAQTHSHRMPLPSPEERRRAVLEAAKRAADLHGPETADMPGAWVEMLFLFGLEITGNPTDLEARTRIHALATAAFEEYKANLPSPVNTRHMAAAVRAAVEIDQEKMGY